MKRLSARLARLELVEGVELVLVPCRPGEALESACRRAGVDALHRPGRVLLIGAAHDLEHVNTAGPAATHHVVDAATAARATQILAAAGACDAGEE